MASFFVVVVFLIFVLAWNIVRMNFVLLKKVHIFLLIAVQCSLRIYISLDILAMHSNNFGIVFTFNKFPWWTGKKHAARKLFISRYHPISVLSSKSKNIFMFLLFSSILVRWLSITSAIKCLFFFFRRMHIFSSWFILCHLKFAQRMPLGTGFSL